MFNIKQTHLRQNQLLVLLTLFFDCSSTLTSVSNNVVGDAGDFAKTGILWITVIDQYLNITIPTPTLK